MNDMTELTIEDKNEILRYSGYRKGINLTEISDIQIQESIDYVNRISAIRTNWKLFDIEECEQGISIKGTSTVLKGNAIRKHLKGCDKAVLMCGTIGPQFDRDISKVMLTNAALGVYMNSCGITLIEKVMDDLQITINKALPEGHLGLRFSPGYADLPLETQKDFMILLNMERVVGIRLGVSYLMNPEKSVTAVAGVRYDDIVEKYEEEKCSSCNKECEFRYGSKCSEQN